MTTWVVSKADYAGEIFRSESRPYSYPDFSYCAYLIQHVTWH